MKLRLLIGVVGLSLALTAFAHDGHDHDHDDASAPVIDVADGRLVSKVSISEKDGMRVIVSNGVPDHDTGRFPNRNNPSAIAEQSYTFRAPLEPKETRQRVELRPSMAFGIALNGVVFDPFTAELWNDDPRWRYEALSGKLNLGLDKNNAHVQPNGAYHYHGIPTGLMEKLVKAKDQMVLLGFAADGYPIYGPFAYSDARDPKSKLVKMKPSYRLKEGARPNDAPPGKYDGSFGRDWEYVEGSGDLDDCNGRFGVTPDYPKGTYYYVLTDAYPFVPRLFRAEPDPSFNKPRPRNGAPDQRPGGGPPSDRRRPPPPRA